MRDTPLDIYMGKEGGGDDLVRDLISRLWKISEKGQPEEVLSHHFTEYGTDTVLYLPADCVYPDTAVKGEQDGGLDSALTDPTYAYAHQQQADNAEDAAQTIRDILESPFIRIRRWAYERLLTDPVVDTALVDILRQTRETLYEHNLDYTPRAIAFRPESSEYFFPEAVKDRIREIIGKEISIEEKISVASDRIAAALYYQDKEGMEPLIEYTVGSADIIHTCCCYFDPLQKGLYPWGNKQWEDQKESIRESLYNENTKVFSIKTLGLSSEFRDYIYFNLNPTAMIDRFFVAPILRNNGIGSALYRQLEQYLDELGFTAAAVYGSCADELSIRNFWQKEGFSPFVDFNHPLNDPAIWNAVPYLYLSVKSLDSERQYADGGEQGEESEDGTGQRDVAGVDFRSLPVHTALDSVSALFLLPPEQLIPAAEMENTWKEIENMVNQRTIPSADRLKQYAATCCRNGSLAQQREKLLLCVAEILRLQEDRCLATEPALKYLLVLLESN